MLDKQDSFGAHQLLGDDNRIRCDRGQLDIDDDLPPVTAVKLEIRKLKRARDIEKNSAEGGVPYLDAYCAAKEVVRQSRSGAVEKPNAGEETFRRTDEIWANRDIVAPIRLEKTAEEIVIGMERDYICEMNIWIPHDRLLSHMSKANIKQERIKQERIKRETRYWGSTDLNEIRREVARLWEARKLSSWTNATLSGVIHPLFKDRWPLALLSTKLASLRKRASTSSKNDIENCLKRSISCTITTWNVSRLHKRSKGVTGLRSIDSIHLRKRRESREKSGP